ncbi:tubulin binding cofactor A [Xylariales sp. PMI_506]|nr:tubulin binding cofactor A [Xylariales sp. PMI_506]
MPAPSPLKIATQAVSRLVTERKYYGIELAAQTKRVEKLEADLKKGEDSDGNAEFMLKQEQKAMQETEAVFGPLKQRIDEAVQRLQEQIAIAESEGEAAGSEELKKAKEVAASVPSE